VSERIFIRQACPDDYSSIATLLNLCFADEPSSSGAYTEESLSHLQSKGNVLFVLVQSNAIVGFVQVDPSRTGIFKLSVDPARRGKRHGHRLMKAAEDYGSSLGWSEALLGVFETRDDLVTYYQKQGYELTSDKLDVEGAAEGLKSC
jgi:ribosomal protein S18 acetylase RimI-like enzyme